MTWSRATLWTQGQPTVLGTLGGADSYGTALNDSGVVVGNSSTTSGLPHAFVFQNGAMRDLGTLGGQYSYANGINNAGDIVGSSWIAGDTASHAFLYTDGKMLDLNTVAPMPPGLYLAGAEDINSQGQILADGDAYGPNSSLDFMTYLLTPIDQPVPADPMMPEIVPEPTVLAMLGLLAVLGGARKIVRNRWRA